MRLLLTLFISLFALSANAQGVATFFYQRGAITIVRAHPPTLANLPWQDDKTPPQAASASFTLNVDIRPATSLYRQDGWMNMGGMAPGSGMLFVFDKPQLAHIKNMEYYQSLDVLWVDADGTITSIAPNLILSQQKEPIIDPKPSKAIILLAGGGASQNSIAPGDKIVGSEYFEAPPQVLMAPH